MKGFPDMQALRAEIDAKNAEIRARYARVHRAFHDVVERPGTADDRAFFVEACEAFTCLGVPSEKDMRAAGITAAAIRWPLTQGQFAYRCIANGVAPRLVTSSAWLYASSEHARAQMQAEIDRALAEGEMR